MAAKKKKVNVVALKRQVRKLQVKEGRSRNKLKSVLRKLRRQGALYKRKLAIKVKTMQSKLGNAKLSSYQKVADDFEKQLIRGIQAKGKAIAKALGKLDKKQLAKLKKTVIKKGRKPKGRKSTSVRRTSVSVKKTRRGRRK